MTTENLVRQRTKTMAHLSLKHVTLLGVVRMKLKMKKKTPKKPRLVAPSNNAVSFLFNEAVAEEQDDDDEDDGDDDETDEQDFEMYDNLGNFITEPSAHQRGMSESEEEDSDTDEDDDKADVVVADDGDLNEQLVQEGEQAAWDHSYADDVEEPRAAVNDYDHAYAIRPKGVSKSKSKIGKKSRYKYSFLFAVVISGVCKKIKNSIPNAVATLSNSKTIILSHINFMLECLDPGLAELCYIDTDSCIWSFTHPQLEDNLLKTKRDRWKSLDVIADEQGALSCHGKLKLEGTFRVGMFKALKIYRLFSTTDFEQERRNKTCYTRCKGVNRNIAKIIPNKIFEKDSTEKVVWKYLERIQLIIM